MKSFEEKSAESINKTYELILSKYNKDSSKRYDAENFLRDQRIEKEKIDKTFEVLKYYQKKCDENNHMYENGNSALESNWHSARDSAYICKICGKEVVK